MEIAPGIHWLERVNANVYACIDDDGGVTLIDTGLPGIDRVDLIFNQLERLKKYPADLRRVLITHADSDHAGNAARIWEESGAEILATAAARESMAAGRLSPRRRNLVQRLMMRFARYPAVPADQVRALDDEAAPLPALGGLEVVPTPGHTLDHVSFFHPASGVLFAGDALNTRRGRLQCTPEVISADMQLAYRSAVRLLQLSPAIFACGHGRPLDEHHVEQLFLLQEKWLENLEQQ